MAQGTFKAVADDLDKALQEADNEKAKFHIRQAAQRVVAVNGESDK